MTSCNRSNDVDLTKITPADYVRQQVKVDEAPFRDCPEIKRMEKATWGDLARNYKKLKNAYESCALKIPAARRSINQVLRHYGLPEVTN